MGPSMLTDFKQINKNRTVELLSVFITFIVEKTCSTIAVVNGKHRSSSCSSKIFCQLAESGAVCS